MQTTVGNGTRSSSETSYLGPGYIDRENLHVLVHSHVTRILVVNDTVQHHKMRFDTVEFTQDAGTWTTPFHHSSKSSSQQDLSGRPTFCSTPALETPTSLPPWALPLSCIFPTSGRTSLITLYWVSARSSTTRTRWRLSTGGMPHFKRRCWRSGRLIRRGTLQARVPTIWDPSGWQKACWRRSRAQGRRQGITS